MSNTSKGKAEKGSKKLMQDTINIENYTKKLNKEILNTNELITWLSPLNDDNYSEYSLNNKKIQEELNINISNWKEIWPTSRQPQWDAIGKTNSTIILVEAKAHKSEIINKINNKSKDLIIEFINDSLKGVEFNKDNNYYQFYNRLAFTKKLKDNGYNVILVFLYFLNDDSYISTTKEEYDKILNILHNEPNIDKYVKELNIKEIFMEIE